LTNDTITEAVLVQIKDILHDVVAVWILNEGKRVVRNFVDELDSLHLRGVINAPLQNAATMTMSSDLDTICCNGVVNELIVFRR